MRHWRDTVTLLLIVAAASTAGGDIIFSDVSISGSLADGASYVTGAGDIDFIFPDAVVGDPVDPRRTGELLISYEARSDAGLDQDFLLLEVLGALSGSGAIALTEVVEDLDDPGVIASYSVVLDENSDLPHSVVLDFDRVAEHVYVQKTLTLEALDTDGFDLANVSFIEQMLHEVPEPGSLVLLVLGMASLATRR